MADKRVVSKLSVLAVRQHVADGCWVIEFELRINGEYLHWLNWFFLLRGEKGRGSTIFKANSSEFISTLKIYPCVSVVPWFVSELRGFRSSFIRKRLGAHLTHSVKHTYSMALIVGFCK